MLLFKSSTVCNTTENVNKTLIMVNKPFEACITVESPLCEKTYSIWINRVFCLCFSFDIILTCGHNEEKNDEELTDVALKLSVRFAERQFLRSARVSGKWSEEAAAIAYFPFIQDQPFRVNSFFSFQKIYLLCIYCLNFIC